MVNLHFASIAGSALVQAFTTVEIFETILHKLELQDILRAQRVNSYFRDIIAQSPSLQQRLFFAPSPSTPLGRQSVLNPLLAALFPPLFSLHMPLTHEPLHIINFIARLEWFTDPARRDAVLRLEASWRRMFPVQPPAKLEAIKIFTYDFCDYDDDIELVRAELGSAYQRLQQVGIKMGLLFDLITHLDSIHSQPSFFVHWQMFQLLDSVGDWETRFWNHYQTSHALPRPDLSDYGPLSSTNLPTQNSITLYYNHGTMCGTGLGQPSPLKTFSTYIAAIEEDPSSLLYFHDVPFTYRTEWTKYVLADNWKELQD